MEANILLNNHKSKISLGAKEFLKLQKAFKLKSPNAFWAVRARGTRSWDGFKPFITDAGWFTTGLLPRVLEYLKDANIPVTIEDNREDFDTFPKIKKETPTGIKFRGYQYDAIKVGINYNVMGIPFYRGVYKVATNGGKTIIAAGLYLSTKLPTLFLVNSVALFEQALEELPRYIGEPVGGIRGKKMDIENLTVAMVPTLYSRLKGRKTSERQILERQLSYFRVGIIDECDLGLSKSYKTISQRLDKLGAKWGMSGTPFMKKDKIKNWELEGLYGPQIYEISNTDLIELGHSTPVKIGILKGNKNPMKGSSYNEQLRLGIIGNKSRNRKIARRVNHYLKRGIKRQLIVVKYRDHTEMLYSLIRTQVSKRYPDVKVDWAHGGRKDRLKVMEAFRDGDIDILVGSFITGRGKNFKLIEYICNTYSGASKENTLQILGRGFRTSKGKEVCYFEDFHDEGKHLKRHSNIRIRAHKNDGHKVIEAYKKVK